MKYRKKQGIFLLSAIFLAIVLCSAVSANDSLQENTELIEDSDNGMIMPDPVISGRVLESPSNSDSNGVLITAQTTGGTILAQTITGSDGTYSMNFISDDTEFRITASKVGYNSYTKDITVSANPADPSDPNLYGTANFRLHAIPDYSGNATSYLLNVGALSEILLDIYAGKTSAWVDSTTSPYASGGGTPLEVRLLSGDLLQGLLDVYSSGDDGPKTGGINPENLPALLQALGLDVGVITAQSNSSTNPPLSSGGSDVASLRLDLLLGLIQVIDLSLISSNSAVTPNFDTGTLISSSGNGVTNISILNGTVVIEALQTSATASANGHPGGANADFNWSVADIKLLGLSILDELTVNGSVTLPGILTISLGAEDQQTSADGTYAHASGNALNIELLSLLLGGVKLTIGHADAEAQVPIDGLDTTTTDLGITKTVDKTIANLGDLLHYTVTVTNNGPDDVSGVTVNDVLPAGLDLVSYSGDGTYDAGLWTINDVLTGGATATLEIFARIIDSNISITNVAIVNIPSDIYDPNPDNDQDEVTTDVLPENDLAVTKTVDRAVANLNDLLHYTITVTNNGPDSVANFTVNDSLSDKLQWISDDGNGAYDHSTGIWTINTALAGGSSAILNITARVISSNTSITNVAIVNVPPGTHDPNPDNDQDEVTVTVNAASDLSINKTVDNATPKYLGNVTFTLTAHNYGPDNADTVYVIDTLPDGLRYVSDDSGGAYDPVTGIWVIGNLNNGATAILHVVAQAMVSNVPLTNVAIIYGKTEGDEVSIYDPNPENNQSSVTVTPYSVPDNPTNPDNPDNPTNPDTPSNTPETVPLLPTGVPLSVILMAILLVSAGLLMPKRKQRR